MRLVFFFLLVGFLACQSPPSGHLGSLEETKKIVSLLGVGSQEEIVPILFVTDWCSACRYAERDLKQKNISFIRANVEKNERAAKIFEQLSLRTGSGGVPQIIVGTEVFVGYNAGAIEKSLAKYR